MDQFEVKTLRVNPGQDYSGPDAKDIRDKFMTATLASKPPNEYAGFLAGYLKKNLNATPDEVATAYACKVTKTPLDRRQNFVDPATGRLVRVEPGQAVPEGARTPQLAGQLNTPTTQMRNVGAQANLPRSDALHCSLKSTACAGSWDR